MPNHGGNLQHHHNELSMKHPQLKYMHMVNKKIAEMLIVFLPCHFGYGKAPVPCARGTPLAVLNGMQILTMTRTYMGPKFSMHEVWPSYSRDMRLPTYISS